MSIFVEQMVHKISTRNMLATNMRHVVRACIAQGELLRQSLLTRYYGKDHPRAIKDGNASTHSGHEDLGDVVLSRAERTLHQVQVLHLSFFHAIYIMYATCIFAKGQNCSCKRRSLQTAFAKGSVHRILC